MSEIVPRPTGVGLALRWAFIDQVTPDTPVGFLEISPENYMRRGGYFPDALANIVAHHPVSTHGLALNIGSSDPLDLTYLESLRGFLDELGVHAHSDHLCWNGTDGRMLHDLLPLPTDDATVRHVADRIRRVQDLLQRPLLLENISYYLLPHRSMPEHEFVTRVLEASDSRLLLDVNNVWVNAQNHGFDPYAYLGTLPLKRVDRIHVAGGERLARYDGLLIDTHGTDVPAEVAEMMAWVIERVGPVPVVYERDHDIPPLPDLVRQVADLQRVYDDAVRRHGTRVPPPDPDATGLHSPGAKIALLPDVQTGLCRAVLDADPPHLRVAARSSTRQLRAGAIETDPSLSPARLDVYRNLVRNSLCRTIRAALPRTVGCFTEEAFEREFSIWLDQEGPRSRYLRDVPQEFAEWIDPIWREDTRVPEYLPDLMLHELVDWEVRAMPSRRPGRSATPWSLDARVDFDGSVRLSRYAWRVHEIPECPRGDAMPRSGDTPLLAYRDEEHDVHHLEVSPLAYEVLSRLASGDTLEAAVVGGTRASGEALDDAILARIGTVLFDLAERGVLFAPSAPC